MVFFNQPFTLWMSQKIGIDHQHCQKTYHEKMRVMGSAMYIIKMYFILWEKVFFTDFFGGG